jgi:hypothetical protein
MRNDQGPGSLQARLEPGDQAHELLAASSVPGMVAAAHKLRLTALYVRQQAMQQPLVNGSGPSLAAQDPELRRMELAELAVDVVTAVDCLLSLLERPPDASPRLLLAGGPSPYRGEGPAGYDSYEQLTRRRLDARGTAVRLGMRLIAKLRSDAAGMSSS